MSNNPYAQPGPYDQAELGVPMESSRTSVLAVMSLISSLICCIPGFGLLGSALGIGAILGISSSRGRVGGKGLAIAGIAVGLAITAVWLAVIMGVAGMYAKFASYGDLIESAQQRDYQNVRDNFDAGLAPTVTDELIDSFAVDVSAEWGTYVGMPPSMIDAFSAYINQIDQQAWKEFQPMQQAFNMQQITLAPLAIEFQKGWSLCVVAFDTNASGTGPNGMPAATNVGVLRDDYSWIWLVPLPTPGGVNSNPPQASPATSTDPTSDTSVGEEEPQAESEPDTDTQGEPDSESEADEEPVAEPATGEPG